MLNLVVFYISYNLNLYNPGNPLSPYAASEGIVTLALSPTLNYSLLFYYISYL